MSHNHQRTLALFVSLALALFAAPPVMAIEDSFYDVQSLRVRAKAKSEVIAKNAAIRNGKQRAFKQMVSRFLTKHDFDRLEQPKIAQIENMIRDLQIEQERYGGGIYIAELNIRFRLENVREYLRDIGFAYSETVARPYLLLPVFVDLRTQSVRLWSSGNIWLDNWLDSKEVSSRNLLPVYLPESTAVDAALLPDVKKVNQDNKILHRIKDYYGTDNVILMTAVGNYQPASDILNGVNVIAHFFTNDWQRDSIEMQFPQTENSTKLLSAARRKIFDEIQDQWKHNTAIELGQENDIRVKVQIRSLREWLEIKKILSAVPDVIDFRLINIGAGEAVIAMTFYGTPERLERALAREFLGLEYQDESKQWILQATRHLTSR